MLAINNQQRYFLYGDVVDMRKGIDVLSRLIKRFDKIPQQRFYGR